MDPNLILPHEIISIILSNVTSAKDVSSLLLVSRAYRTATHSSIVEVVSPRLVEIPHAWFSPFLRLTRTEGIIIEAKGCKSWRPLLDTTIWIDDEDLCLSIRTKFLGEDNKGKILRVVHSSLSETYCKVLDGFLLRLDKTCSIPNIPGFSVGDEECTFCNFECNRDVLGILTHSALGFLRELVSFCGIDAFANLHLFQTRVALSSTIHELLYIGVVIVEKVKFAELIRKWFWHREDAILPMVEEHHELVSPEPDDSPLSWWFYVREVISEFEAEDWVLVRCLEELCLFYDGRFTEDFPYLRLPREWAKEKVKEDETNVTVFRYTKMRKLASEM